ncbi:MAG: hypothetical protein AVDCRST_MAG72-746, partial [uncultured Nocardioidaceae bacterium]
AGRGLGCGSGAGACPVDASRGGRTSRDAGPFAVLALRVEERDLRRDVRAGVDRAPRGRGGLLREPAVRAARSAPDDGAHLLRLRGKRSRPQPADEPAHPSRLRAHSRVLRAGGQRATDAQRHPRAARRPGTGGRRPVRRPHRRPGRLAARQRPRRGPLGASRRPRGRHVRGQPRHRGHRRCRRHHRPTEGSAM